MTTLIRCANCLAPLRQDVGLLVLCTYCGAQTRLDAPESVAKPGAPSGARLAEAVSFVINPTFSIPLLKAGASVPIFNTETLSTSDDNQPELKVNLVEGSRPLASLVFPIRHRGPRGTAKIALTVRVAPDGAMSLTLAEPGTDNILDHAGMSVRVLA